MLVPPCCLTCGMPIGDVAIIFFEMQKELIQKILRQASIDSGLQIPLGEILDTLQIHGSCCRTHLMTTVKFKDYF